MTRSTMVKHKLLGKHDKLFGLVGFLLSVLSLRGTIAAGYFEDADQSNDFLSSSPYHHFDLRHTIPGEPHVDYPIYSTVPRTSFACADKHEGYYADTETRCQAFRICTHTARSDQGFGFLCPNGTLFSQKNFVCDWYRNVNCEESELYYSKNNANRIGSKQDIMETVRQMMEYPMKTISKALQRTTGNSNRPTLSAFGTHNEGDDSAVSTRNAPTPNFNSGRKTPVTRAEVESVSKYGSDNLTESVAVAETQNSAKPFNPQNPVDEEEFSIDLRSSQDSFGSDDTVPVDVYVNSLGELSTDPGVNFDKTQSRIIALGPQDREKKLNFAQTINVALNNLDDLSPTTAALAPDYVKRMRSTQEGTFTNLANNINDLQQKSTVVQQAQNPPHKHGIRLLSRGFSAQEDNGKRTTAPYRYNKPKQTPSTIRFTPNALPSDSLKPPSYDDSKSELHKAINTLVASNEEILEPFSFTATTPKLQISKDRDYLAEAASSASPDDGAYLSPPSLETPEVNDVTDFEPIRVFNEERDDFNSADSKNNNSAQVDKEITALISPNQNLEIDEEKITVNKHAANLLLAGVKLSLLDAHPNNNAQPAEEISPPKKPITTATVKRIAATKEISPTLSPRTTTTEATTTTKTFRSPTTYTSAMSTSTETVTEISSIQKRVRNFRRFATVRRASIKPEVVAKRTYVRTVPRSIRATSRTTTTAAPTSTTTTTSRTPTTPIRSYQKRLATNRFRLPKVTTERSTTTKTSTTRIPTIQTPATTVRYARHSDRETATYGYNPDASSSSSSSNSVSGAATWESVRRNLQRFQINRNSSAENSYDTTSETPKTRLTTIKAVRTSTTKAPTFTSKPQRSRMRTSNFKTQQTVAHSITPTRTTKPKTTKSRTIATRTTNSPKIFASQQEKQSNYIPPFTLPTTSITHSSYPSSTSSLPSTVDLNFLSNFVQIPSESSLNFGQQSSSLVSDTLSPVSPTSASTDFLSFDKLTQSIVDNSILQNFHSNQLVSSQPINQYDSTIAASNIHGRSSLQSSGNGLSVNQIRQFGYKKQAAKAPSELTPPIRPQYLPQTSAIPTVQLPRIVIARAEGQRIEPNSVQSIITNLIDQPTHGAKSTQTKTPYVPLKDFLTSKFGVDQKKNNIHQPQQQQQHQQQQLQYQSNGNFNFQQEQPQIQQQVHQQQPIYQVQRTHYQQQQPTQQHYQQPQQQSRQQTQRQYQQQQPQYQQQPIQPYQQQQHTPYQQQQQQPAILSASYIPPQVVQQQEIPFGLAVLNKIQAQHQQTQQQQKQPQLQQQNIFSNYPQHQEQLPQFPPLRNTQSQHQPQQQHSQSSNTVQQIGSVNVPLPALPNGLLPSISAQRRSDDAFEQLDLSSDISARPSAYDGASSYDVPINSIGRLPNDKTLLRQRQRRGRRY